MLCQHTIYATTRVLSIAVCWSSTGVFARLELEEVGEELEGEGEDEEGEGGEEEGEEEEGEEGSGSEEDSLSKTDEPLDHADDF